MDLFDGQLDEIARAGPAVVDVGDAVDLRRLAHRAPLEQQLRLFAHPVDEDLDGLPDQPLVVPPVDRRLKFHDLRLPLCLDLLADLVGEGG